MKPRLRFECDIDVAVGRGSAQPGDGKELKVSMFARYPDFMVA